MLRSIRCLTGGGGGGGQRIFYLDLIFNVTNYCGIKVWLGGRKARQTRFFGWEGSWVFPEN